MVVVDGRVGPEHDGISNSTLIFSANSKQVAYVAVKGSVNARKKLVVVDGELGPEYFDIVCGPVFRPAGEVEYLAIKNVEGLPVLYRVTHPRR